MPTPCTDYDFRQIEPHWQRFWESDRTFRSETGGARPKYYVLDMFPYPSGAGLHIGHPEGYTATDIVARYKRAKGFNVLHPIGWDSFGLPAEQHAVKTGTHPATNTAANIANFTRQIKALGFSYDWERELATTDEKYYRWTQWIFLQLFKKGLAYVDERPVWWCPELRTVLANEEVVDGKSEVGGFPVERRNLRQWVLRITAYAERMLADLKDVDWPESTKRMQEAWIGRSEGAEVSFEIERRSGFTPDVSGINPDLQKLKVFTTRPDTLFGCTYMVLAPEHPLVDALTTPEQRDAVAVYRRKTAGKSDLERTDLAKEKSGVFTGSYAINPVNGERVPVWIADYVLTGYGTGAIMAVPAHDERDFEFAKKYDLKIKAVVGQLLPRVFNFDPKVGYYHYGLETITLNLEGENTPVYAYNDCCTTESGVAVNSDFLNGLSTSEAKGMMSAWLEKHGHGKQTITYKLRDWLFSRQRYWGEPFPIVWVSEADYRRAAAVHTDLPASPVTFAQDGVTHFALPLPAGALPLTLPEVSSYLPSGNGESPLANVTDWLEIWFNFKTGESVAASQPQPVGEHWVRGRRETNTMPQWAGSCWYYLRFTDPANAAAFASPEALRYWGVPDLYVGGAEHAVLHLLYARFWHKVLFDLGVVPQSEPFTKLFHQGIILGEDGEKMSKSRGNVVSPDTIIASHGTDTLRLYLMFLGPLEAMKPWSMKQIEGVHRFLQKVWRECVAFDGGVNPKIAADAADDPALEKLLHETIKKVGEDIESLRLNTAVSQMMIFANALQKAPAVSRATVLAFLRVLAPFAPHLTEELWERLGEKPSIQRAPWPAYDPAKLVASEVKIVVQVNGKHRGEVMAPAGARQEEAVTLARTHERVAPFIAGKTFKRIVFVPGKILNIVVEQ
jgi:leucyl-tRNA synthetase